MTSDPQQLFPGKQFISTVLAALETKTTMSGKLARRYLQRAGMAGMIIGVLFAANFAVVAAFDQARAQASATGTPQVILADTRLANGVPVLEVKEKLHFLRVAAEEWPIAKQQLTAGYQGQDN